MLSISKEGVFLEYPVGKKEEVVLYRVEGKEIYEVYRREVRWEGKPHPLQELWALFDGSLEDIKAGLEKLVY